MKRIFSLILAVLLIILPLASCTQKTEEEGYFTRTKRDSRGRLSVSLCKTDKDGSSLSEDKLATIYDEACSIFADAYDFLSANDGNNIAALNANAEAVFDINKKLIQEIDYARSLSESCDGLYEPFGGSLTSILKRSDALKKEEIAEALTHIGSDKFEFSESSVKKSDPLAMIDLGALCDGYAIDAVCDYLSDSDCAYGTVSFNGIAGVFGKKPEGVAFSVEIGDGDTGVFNIKDGYIALVSDDFGTSYDFSDGVIDGDVQHVAVYAKDARIAAVVASVGYAYGIDSVLKLYDKKELEFEAVILKIDGKEIYTKNARASELYTPVTTAEEK